ncbi:MAG TPA: hypothetical protein VKB46_17195 [Pyrinomonadaceae bacterium]|nr:hypothetical protein [Pyrinomonadaceae bacterium]
MSQERPPTPVNLNGSSLLAIDQEIFRGGFNRHPFTIQHRLADHPLFTLEQLVGLAKRLPAQNVKYQAADLPVNHGLYDGPQTGLSTEETIRQIEECKSWMVIKQVENDPLYRELLDHCLDEIQDLSEPLEPGMCKREGFIFVSSPSAVTPYHMDPEYNFLLQVKGRKTVHMFDGTDPSIVSPKEREEFMASDGNYKLTFKDEYETKAQVFDLTPGVGLHFPVMTPHWVQNGDQVSISFSITFRTPTSERWSMVNDVNVRLRRFGLEPTPFGRSRLRDSAKYQAYRVLRRAKELMNP